MKTATLILQNLIRLIGLTLIVLGLQFWMKRALGYVGIHMRLGELLVLLLWILAWMALRAGVRQQLVIIAILYGFLLFLFAVNMGRLLPGSSHEVIRVAHLLLGLGAIGFAESLGKRIKQSAQ